MDNKTSQYWKNERFQRKWNSIYHQTYIVHPFSHSNSVKVQKWFLEMTKNECLKLFGNWSDFHQTKTFAILLKLLETFASMIFSKTFSFWDFGFQKTSHFAQEFTWIDSIPYVRIFESFAMMTKLWLYFLTLEQYFNHVTGLSTFPRYQSSEVDTKFSKMVPSLYFGSICSADSS